MIRIAIAGGPGSGKTSLARQLTTELYNRRQLNCQYVPEFARDHINACRERQEGVYRPNMADQILLYHSQAAREREIPPKATFMVTDSPVFLPLVFARRIMEPDNYQDRVIFFHLYEDWLAHYFEGWYGLVLFVKREKEFLKDGTRGESSQEADEIGVQIEAFLRSNGVNFYHIGGSDEKRVHDATELALHLHGWRAVEDKSPSCMFLVDGKPCGVRTGEKTIGQLLFREAMTKEEFYDLLQRKISFVDDNNEDEPISFGNDHREEQGNG